MIKYNKLYDIRCASFILYKKMLQIFFNKFNIYSRMIDCEKLKRKNLLEIKLFIRIKI